ncbi:MAG: SRPBCC domain-containing protein [Terricaulis sp.]
MSIEVTQPSDRQVRVVRTFKAPRQLVWDAHTKPELMKKWCYGYEGWTLATCDMDVREGGKYRWRWRNGADGSEFGFFGTFSEVNEPSKLAHDQYFDPGDMNYDMPVGDPSLIALDFSEAAGVTTLAMTMTFVSKDARDQAVTTGMTDGMEVGYARIDAMLEKAA